MESFAEIRRAMFPEAASNIEAVGGRPTILIVDDNVDIIEALTTVLRSHYRLITCLSYEDAKRALVAEIKVILLDIKMAGKDGIEAYRLLKELRSDLRIIFHSAYPGSSEKSAAIEGLDHSGYLTKGDYQTPELLAVIEAALNSIGSLTPNDVVLMKPFEAEHLLQTVVTLLP